MFFFFFRVMRFCDFVILVFGSSVQQQAVVGSHALSLFVSLVVAEEDRKQGRDYLGAGVR